MKEWTMSARPYFRLILLITAGFAAGGLSRFHVGSRASTTAPKLEQDEVSRREVVAEYPINLPRSTDTAEALLAPDALNVFSRTTLWFCDAEVHELEDFWRGYEKRDSHDWLLMKLMLIRWTSLDPRGALRIFEGTPWERLAWLGWAENDPDAALKASKGTPWEASVVGEILKRDPERREELLERFPMYRSSVFGEVARNLARTNPEAALDFVSDSQPGLRISEIMRDWLRDDPRAAFLWALEDSNRWTWKSGYLDQAIEQLASDEPEVLRDLMSTMPEGSNQRKVDRALFELLSDRDPDEALEVARGSSSPWLMAEKMSILGRKLADRDPERAFGIMEELFKVLPDPTRTGSRVYSPSSPQGTDSASLDELVEFTRAMVSLNPQRTMEVYVTSELPHGVHTVGHMWVERDEVGFGEWIEGQAPGELRDLGVWLIANQLSSQGNVLGAMEWAMNGGSGNRANAMSTVADNWSRSDPAGMRAWLESAEIPDSDRRSMEQHLKEK